MRDEPHACALLKGAAVEIWQCDAWGYYSGYPTARPGGTVPAASQEAGGNQAGTYLRGFRTTGSDGVAEFATIFPGWYASRAPTSTSECTPVAGRPAAPTRAASSTGPGSSSSTTATPTRCTRGPRTAGTRASAAGSPRTRCTAGAVRGTG
ncbi:hypothetical protein ACFQ0G_33545 [Streptomyces chiangmaiensis]